MILFVLIHRLLSAVYETAAWGPALVEQGHPGLWPVPTVEKAPHAKGACMDQNHCEPTNLVAAG